MARRTGENMKRYLVGAAAVGLLVAGCSSGSGEAVEATPAENLEAATATRQMGQELASQVGSSARATCAALDADSTPQAYRARTSEMRVLVALSPSSGQAKDVHVWATDQQIHAYCPKYAPLTSYPPAWEEAQ